MYNDEDLDAAVAAGVLGADTAEAFRAHVASRRQAPVVDEEHFRLVSGFNDIFVVIASALLLMAVGSLGALARPWVAGAAVAATAWALAEFFTRRRRMALPSIVLLLAFVVGAFAFGLKLQSAQPGNLVLGCALALVAAAGHWRRFKVPITVAVGVGAAVGFVAALLPAPEGRLLPVLFAAGLACFALALRWDISDRLRRTRRADVAFWLHLLAAPLIVHPVFGLLDWNAGAASVWQAALVLLLYIGIALLSLVIDRRALMVSALGYVLIAFGALANQRSIGQLGFALAALVIGASLLLLSAYWQASRRFALRGVPAGWRDRLAPLRAQGG